MKKFTLLLSAMLFSMMSFAAVVTFDADTDKGNATDDYNKAAAYTITKNGVTKTALAISQLHQVAVQVVLFTPITWLQVPLPMV